MIPLHRLPERAVDIVLRNMTTMNQFLLSLYYDHVKSRIKSFDIGIDLKFTIVIRDYFWMCISDPDHNFLTFTFYTLKDGTLFRQEGEPKRSFSENDLVSISFDGDDRIYGWTFEAQKSARQWILLIIEVFNLKKIDDLKYETDDYCFDSVKDMLKGIPLERLNITGDEAARNYDGILKTVPPCTHLVQETNPGEKFRSVLLQNFESLRASLLNFSELLIINSKFLSIYGEKFTIKNMNTFLKLWRKGSNPNAKHFSMSWVPIPDNDDIMNVLKAIPYEAIPDAVERLFLRFPFSLPVTYEKIRGGFDIKRMTDGRKATVKLHGRLGSFSFELFVWDE
ncbi:hypothetical protein CAEBREN_25748 [Caenorhabditis brenneri]|uniref:Sdz-33 F-box domain-containing protein n=1 Tax=Caenorhabditis brenneri TaxID=135651 RepID=G0MBP3_CAEBE|nr:hypothetical protein CAEBREN_25748 [Caenorhabditis brenneri]